MLEKLFSKQIMYVDCCRRVCGGGGANGRLLPRRHQLHLRDVQLGVLGPHLLPVSLPLPPVQR